MNTALHTVGYGGVWPGQARLSLFEVVDRAAELGFDGLMLMAKRPHASPLDLDEAKRRELKAKIRDRGLEVSALAAYTDFTANPERPDVPTAEMQTIAVRRLGELAHELECPVIRVFTGYEREGLPPREAWNACVRWLRECARQVSPLGVTLAVQNHHDIAVHHESMAALLAEVDQPNCRAGFDAWNLMLQNVDVCEAARTMAPMTVITITADYVRRSRFRYRPDLVSYGRDEEMLQAVPFGDGEVDYRSFFRGLYAGGFDGPIVYEMCSPLVGGGSLENLDQYARVFLERIRPVVEAAVES